MIDTCLGKISYFGHLKTFLGIFLTTWKLCQSKCKIVLSELLEKYLTCPRFLPPKRQWNNLKNFGINQNASKYLWWQKNLDRFLPLIMNLEENLQAKRVTKNNSSANPGSKHVEIFEIEVSFTKVTFWKIFLWRAITKKNLAIHKINVPSI